MWNNQKDLLKDDYSNTLVVADTSGSMTQNNFLPLSNSIGLAIYTAQRNKGYFHNYFITFSSSPKLQTIKGDDIYSIVNNVKMIVDNTDIDKVFELILNTSLKMKDCLLLTL